jgi:hypothetical protein
MTSKRLMQLLLGAGWLGTLIFTFLFLTLTTLFILDPWDSVPPEFYAGTVSELERSVARFFGNGPGAFFLSGPFLIASCWLAWKTIRKRWQKLLELGILNLLLTMSILAQHSITRPLNQLFVGPNQIPGPYSYSQPIPVYGFQFSIIPMFVIILLCSLWLYVSYRISKNAQFSKQKRKREATQPDTSRLASHDNAYTDHHEYIERTSLAGEMT